MTSRARVAFTVLLVYLACFLSSLAMLGLRFTDAGPAILYPPYAILTAALLLSAPRHWWMYMLASSAAGFLPHSTQSPTPYVLLTELANYTKAGAAAGGVRRLGAPRFDTLRSMAAFLLFAVVIGPISAAFMGALVAVLFHGANEYWLVWRGWFLSNALTGLALLPIIVIAITDARSWKRASPRRLLEAALLVGALLAVGIYVFALPHSGVGGLSARLYAPLPILLWAAVRFGPAGTSTSILIVTVLAIWGALAGKGPFVAQSPAENLIELQLFILAMSVPLMLLAAVVEERRNKELALRSSEAALRTSYAQVRNLVGRLITAQETERSFIARELHDDICQRLAGLTLMLDNVLARLPASAAVPDDEITRTREAALDVMETARNLSYELHPGTLRYIGLVDVLQDHCNRFTMQHSIQVTLSAPRELGSIPTDTSLCLYRVTQEALRNVAAHSGARNARVILQRNNGRLELTVSDDGRGFDPDAGPRSSGLGLVSLDERVRLLGGSIRIESELQHGTRMFVEVPVTSSDMAAALSG